MELMMMGEACCRSRDVGLGHKMNGILRENGRRLDWSTVFRPLKTVDQSSRRRSSVGTSHGGTSSNELLCTACVIWAAWNKTKQFDRRNARD
jgi:hypothetical protein